MTKKEWSFWLLAAGITALLTVIAVDFESGDSDTGTPSISLANMTRAQKDSVIRTELSLLKEGEEVISLRDTHIKVLKGKQGAFAARIYTEPQHYLDDADSVYRPIDLTVKKISELARLNPLRKFDAYVEAGLYRATWFDTAPWNYTLYSGDYHVTYTALFDTSKTVHVLTEPTNTGIKQSVVLDDSAAASATELRWRIGTNALYTVTGGELIFTDDTGRFLFRAPKPTAWDSRGFSLAVDARFSGDMLTYSLKLPLPDMVTWPVTIDPSTTISGANVAGIYKVDADYLTARNASSGDVHPNNNYAGQWTTYCTGRAPIFFNTSVLPDGAMIDSARVVLSINTLVGSGFKVFLAEGTYTGATPSGSWLNDFEGWASSGVYLIPALGDSLNPVSAGDSLVFKLNATGIEAISTTDTTRFMALSSHDICAVQPSSNEFQGITAASSYLAIWYKTIIPPTNFRMDNPTTTSIRAQYTRHHSANVDSVGIVSQDGTFITYFDAVTDTVKTVSALSPNTQYIWRCYVDSLGQKVYSNFDTLKTDEAAPGNFMLTVLSPDSIRATWTDNADSEEWFVLLNTADSTQVAGTDTLPPNTTSITVGNLTPNTLYEWFVKTRLAGGDSTSLSDSDRTQLRLPGTTAVITLSPYTLRFIVAPEDNPSYTQYAVQDSLTGLYADGTAEPETLRAGPLGDWGWKTFAQWGGVQGDTLAGLLPDSLYVIRVKARTGE